MNNTVPENHIRCEFDKIVKTTYPNRNQHGAHLVDFGDKEVWIPKSQCEVHYDEKKIDIAEWLYKKLEL